MNLSQLKEEDLHNFVLNINAKGGGDSEGGAGDDIGTIHCLLQVTNTNVEEANEANPIDWDLISRRYVSSCDNLQTAH